MSATQRLTGTELENAKQEFGINGYAILRNIVPREGLTALHTALKEKFAPHGPDATSNSPQEFAAFVKQETERYARIAKIAGIEPE